MKYKIYFTYSDDNKFIFESNDIKEIGSELERLEGKSFHAWEKWKELCEEAFEDYADFDASYYVVVDDDFSKLYDVSNYYLLFKEEKND